MLIVGHGGAVGSLSLRRHRRREQQFVCLLFLLLGLESFDVDDVLQNFVVAVSVVVPEFPEVVSAATLEAHAELNGGALLGLDCFGQLHAEAESVEL